MSTGFLPREDAPPPREPGGLAAAARLAAASEVTETPLLSARWLEAKLGGSIRLKAENLQRTGSFKVRGATAKLNRLERARAGVGVVAASAGNHGQAVAYAARAKGVACRVFMPEAASVAKVEAVEAYGGSPDLGGLRSRTASSARRRLRPSRAASSSIPSTTPTS